ncbi:MAG: hypothetical protein D6797_04865 [Bdellovibrio sp.]|nr:MAG: hypothetical protein D6797_04865 [Bdellovibrio sp.]
MRSWNLKTDKGLKGELLGFWEEVKKKDLGLLLKHRLGGFLYYQEKRPELYSEWKQQWIQNQILVKEMESLFHDFTPKPIFLKGLALVTEVYPDLGTRFFSDVDILIEKPFLSSLIDFLEQKGYVQIKDFKWYGNQYKTLLQKDSITLEVHTQLFFHETNHSKWPTCFHKGTRCRQLTPEAQLVHLAGHVAFQHNFLYLHWLLDIHLLLQKKELCWEKVWSLAKDKKVLRSLKAVLWVLKHYFKTPIPQEIMIGSRGERWIFSKILVSDFLWGDQKDMRYFFLKHFLKDSFLLSLKYDWLWWMHHAKRPRNENCHCG